MARRALHPHTLAAVQAVQAALTPADRALLVACSGGPDSLALAVAAGEAARRRCLALWAAIVDHGLQPGSEAVAERARRQLVELGYDEVEVVGVRVAARSPGGPESAARSARYGALARLAEARGATVLLGHTLDDQAETVLLGLVRGSGLRSLAGMAARSGRWVRPFLGLRRAETQAVCDEVGLVGWLDPHNHDPAYARVRVRQEVLPLLEARLGPGVTEALARTAALAREDADLLDQLAAAADPGTATLPCELLAGLAPALRGRVLRRWLTRCGAVDLAYGHVVAVDRLVTAWHGQGPLDLPGVSVARKDGALCCR